MRTLAPAALLFTTLVASGSALADTYEMGVRVGGYGFRREGEQIWDECRMNGFGIFGGRQLRGPLFVEAGLDLYGSVGDGQPMDLPVDRASGLVSTAVGARTQVTSWLRGYVQLGGGVELTSVSVPYGDDRIRDRKVLPEGFFGAGIDIRFGTKTYGGASFRTHLMGNFNYDPARLDSNAGWIAAPRSEDVFATSPDLAAQVQFYLRREI